MLGPLFCRKKTIGRAGGSKKLSLCLEKRFSYGYSNGGLPATITITIEFDNHY